MQNPCAPGGVLAEARQTEASYAQAFQGDHDKMVAAAVPDQRGALKLEAQPMHDENGQIDPNAIPPPPQPRPQDRPQQAQPQDRPQHAQPQDRRPQQPKSQDRPQQDPPQVARLDAAQFEGSIVDPEGRPMIGFTCPDLPLKEFNSFEEAARILDVFAARNGMRLAKSRILRRPDGNVRHICLACECNGVSQAARTKKSGCKFYINLNHQKATSLVTVTTYYPHHNHIRRHPLKNVNAALELESIDVYRDLKPLMREALQDKIRQNATNQARDLVHDDAKAEEAKSSRVHEVPMQQRNSGLTMSHSKKRRRLESADGAGDRAEKSFDADDSGVKGQFMYYVYFKIETEVEHSEDMFADCNRDEAMGLDEKIKAGAKSYDKQGVLQQAGFQAVFRSVETANAHAKKQFDALVAGLPSSHLSDDEHSKSEDEENEESMNRPSTSKGDIYESQEPANLSLLRKHYDEYDNTLRSSVLVEVRRAIIMQG